MTDPETIQVYSNHAGDYARKFERKKPDKSLKDFLALLPNGGTVHDLGCGPGQSSAIMRDAGFNVTASDACPEMVALAKDTFDLDASVATFEDFDAIDTYDGVWANFSLLHAPREKFPDHIAAIKTALRADGILHLGLKTGSDEKRDTLGRLYIFYTVAELTKTLENAGFKLLSVTKGAEAGLAGTVDPFVIILARG